MPILQSATLLVAVVALYFSIRRIQMRPDKIWLRLPVVFLIIHVFIFYGYVFLKGLGIFPDGSIWPVLHSGDWSSALRLHSLFTYLLLEIYGFRRDSEWIQER